VRLRFLFMVLLFVSFHTPAFAQESVDVSLSELYPNPLGDDLNSEWIELYNAGTNEVSLSGWTLKDTDGSVKTYTFSNQSIEAGSYLVIPKTISGITLNNDHDGVVLSSPDGTTSQTRYDHAIPEDISWSLLQGVWNETSPTPGVLNEEPTVTPSPSPSSSPTPFPSTPLPSSSSSLLPTPSTFPSMSLTSRPSLSEVKACGSEGEWVELYNAGDSDVNLDDWSLGDLRSSVKTLNGLTIQPHQYLAIDFTYAVLNNSGDDVRLLFDGEVIEQFSYIACQNNTSWAKENNVWAETNCPTKGSVNSACVAEKSTVEKSVLPSSSPAVFTPQKEASASTTSTTVPTKPTLSYVLPSLVQTWSNEVAVTTVSAEVQVQSVFHSPQQEKRIYPGEFFLMGGGCFFLSCSTVLFRMLQF